MPCVSIWLVCLLVGSTTAPTYPPIRWSPDGQWVAYTTADRPEAGQLPSGWLFGEDEEGEEAAPPSPPSYRIWATRPRTGESVLLERSAGPLTSPAWNPDGTALAFGRLVPEAEGRARFEVVIQDAPGRQRVIRVEPTTATLAGAAELPGSGVAWSPDGRYLAVPRPRPRALLVVRADDGRLLHTIEGADLPAWSPDGGRLAFHGSSGNPGLFAVDMNLGPPRPLSEAARPDHAPQWTRDGQSLLVVKRDGRGGLGPAAWGRSGLFRIGSEDGAATRIYPAIDDEIGAEPGYRALSFGVSRDGDELFFAACPDRESATITWFRIRDGATLKPFSPFDLTVPLGMPSTSPSGGSIAVRIGMPGASALAATCDPVTERLVPLAPDDASRAAWLALILETTRGVLHDHYPAPDSGRPTILPIPGEEPNQGEAAYRLRRLARLGRLISDPPGDASTGPDPEFAGLFDRARLVFACLEKDQDAAMESLEAIERTTSAPDHRLRLLGLRAQIHLGRGDTDRARDAIDYLRTALPGPDRRVEWTPTGPVLSADPGPAGRWTDLLARLAEGGKPGKNPAGAHQEPEDAVIETHPDFGVRLESGRDAPVPPSRVAPMPLRDQVEIDQVEIVIPFHPRRPEGR